mgnify:CR=1 FL=1
MTVKADGTASIQKHYCLGRISHELVQVMPDERTTLMGDDATNADAWRVLEAYSLNAAGDALAEPALGFHDASEFAAGGAVSSAGAPAASGASDWERRFCFGGVSGRSSQAPRIDGRHQTLMRLPPIGTRFRIRPMTISASPM